MELRIQNPSKTHANSVHALKNLSLTIPSGMFGLPGPNGAEAAGRALARVS
jgi:ABC-2 type transport system ATP-binding protein